MATTIEAGIAELDTDRAKIQRFLLWMEENGAVFPPVRIEVGNDGSRCIRSAMPVVPGGLIMHVPQSLMITTEVAKASKAGKLITEIGAQCSDYGYLAAFLLQITREGGFWKPYVDILPREFPSMPLLFPDDDLAQLQASSCVAHIVNQKEWLDYEHANIIDKLPDDLKFTREEFAWAKCIVTTRVHSARIDGVDTVAMVPLADLPNHAHDYCVKWSAESSVGFVYCAARKLEAGEELTISYGDKPNGTLFYVYGFCLPNNTRLEAEIKLPDLPADHPCADYASGLGFVRDGKRIFKATNESTGQGTNAMLSYLRLFHLDTPPQARQDAADWEVPPKDRTSERAVLKTLAAACEEGLAEFATTIAQDEALLSAGGMTYGRECAVRVRLEEKTVLKFLLDFANEAGDIIDRIEATQRFSGYFSRHAANLWMSA